MVQCTFCGIGRKEKPAIILDETSEFITFFDVNPINPGHVLVIPKAHHEFIWELDTRAYQAIFDYCRRIATILQGYYKPKTIGMVVEGLSVHHLHIHLIPVNNVNELNPERAKPADLDELKQVIVR